ncbi:hypothetical protein MTP99_007551 [Tenebrio molitor]|nr:hypothetical protein MTP99_007551 [Tenebrio molitor]
MVGRSRLYGQIGRFRKRFICSAHRMMSPKGGQGWVALGSPAFELGEQTAPRSSDQAKMRDKRWIVRGLYDGLWQGPRVGLSGQHEPSPKGGRGAGLRTAEIRGADSSSKLTNML